MKQQLPPCSYPSVFFGQRFLQDGGEPLNTYVRQSMEWLVLDTDETGRTLLLSKCILRRNLFADGPFLSCRGVQTCWKDCWLRCWLNEKFLQESFSWQERRQICPDGVFLLSQEEVTQYLPAEKAIALEPMLFGAGRDGSRKAPLEISHNRHCWWTRSSGTTGDKVVCVGWEGSFFEENSTADEVGIRPAMWVRFDTA